jgi:hypothetical protein
MSLFFSNTVFGIPVDLAYHLVCWIAAILAPLLGGLATAAAIIAFTVAIRLLLLPLAYFAVRGSVRGEGARARLQPKIAELQRRHARNPQRLQEELSALYRAEGSGMFAGCLPLLLQVPFFSVMYRLFADHSVGGGPELAAHPQPARGAARQSLARRGGPAQRAGGRVRGAVRAAGRRRGAGGPGGAAGHPAEGRSSKIRSARIDTGSARRTGRPRGQPGRLGDPVRVPGDRRDRAAGRRSLPAHHNRLDARRANRAATPLYFPNGNPPAPRPVTRVWRRPGRQRR